MRYSGEGHRYSYVWYLHVRYSYVWAVALAALSLAVSAGAQIAPTDLPELSFDETEVARIETLASSDRDAARARAEPLKAGIEQQLESGRYFADEAAGHAGDWRELAEDARADARTNRERAERARRDARDPLLSERTQQLMADQAVWWDGEATADEARAEEREQNAVAIQRDAQKLFDQVSVGGELVERLNRVLEEPEPEAAAEAPNSSAENPEEAGAPPEAGEPLEFDVWEMLGMWRPSEASGGESFPFVIVQEDPGALAYPYRLEAHTGSRVWKGNYTSWDAGDPHRPQSARIVFEYEPSVDEMNSEMPLWVRQGVEGKLRWRLDLDEAGTDFEPELRMKFFPGEVRWSEGDERSAEVIGEGLPRVFQLEPVDSIEVEAWSQATLDVSLQGSHDPRIDPVEALLQHQRFHVRVVLPAEMARNQGTTLEIAIKGMSGGDTTSLTLTGHAPVGLRPVTYTNVDPVTIADCNIVTEPDREPQIMSLAWIFGVEGNCLDLSVVNGEKVEFRFDEASQEVVLFDSWVQRARDRHAQGVARLRAVLEPALNGQTQGADREAVRKRIRMLANFDTIRASEKLTDLHRYALGEAYLGEAGNGLVFTTDEDLESRYQRDVRELRPPSTDPNYFNPLMQAYLEGLSGEDLSPDAHTAADAVGFTSQAEQYYVTHALRSTSERLASRSIQTWAEQFSFGLYDGLVTTSVAGPLYLVVTGQDHFGRAVPTWMRLTAAIGLTSSAILTVTGSTSFQSFEATRARRANLGRTSTATTTIVGRGTRTVARLDGAEPLPDLPDSLSGPQRRQTVHRLDGTPDAKTSTGCVPGGERPPREYTIHNRSQNPGADPIDEVVRDEMYVAKYYGSESELIDPWGERLTERQRQKSCQAMAINYGIFKATGRRISEQESHLMIHQLMEAEYAAGKLSLAMLVRGDGLLRGYSNHATHRYLRYLGARVAKVYAPSKAQLAAGQLPGRLRMRDIRRALDEGWVVKLVIRFKQGYHAVIADSVVRNAAGKITHVRVYDSNVGRLVQVPTGRLRELIPTPESHPPYSIMTVFRFD